ncbi:MAG: LSU ribosomal protein L29 RpmC [Bacteroidetes bacterium HLUCCA01]|nr:MAG: LSU ribosomal protein L29 RpmC [Bacteroidetes bacterium HLUCCA01]
MKAHELRELSIAELESRLKDEAEAIKQIRFNKAVAGPGDNPAKIRIHRRELARLKTIMAEKSGEELVNESTD